MIESTSFEQLNCGVERKHHQSLLEIVGFDLLENLHHVVSRCELLEKWMRWGLCNESCVATARGELCHGNIAKVRINVYLQMLGSIEAKEATTVHRRRLPNE